MTDITELAQRMRIAATMASQGAWSYVRSGFNSIVRTSANLPSGGASRVVLCKLFRSEWRGELKTAQDAQFIALANPANVLTLVEALEKTQQERDNWHNSFDNERFRADKLKAHIDEMTEEQTACINELSRIIQKEVKAKREAKQRIAELESRTVTVKLPQAVSAGGQGYQEQVERILTDAGIKVEAE
ncbi:ead/Ea22-like family protein [Klebsiella pneumoniae]|uniref:ead/Ea22-like family protein n=1 Tax=Klebsiella pneumoniae TaxID=573 RepID=UPI0019583B8D|nr:ead/Ea22-like family protein [Klebsiella pneumoniae]QRR64835.1 ead/Ea22-like family protein [Klebsiella pneumoniae]